jgi:23S rRNA U2552 (ribose-2'-O)-methylase RlmE/FtsJ
VQLIDKKKSIETIENEDKWEYYKKINNPYELVYTTSGKFTIPQSLSLLHPLSRSYFKLIEMFQISNVINDIDRNNIRTGHLCEGPGGFIEATYHSVDKSRKKMTNCYAMSLKSTKSHVPGWKRASTFLKKHPEINIIYGTSGTGDILDPINQESFIKTATTDGKLYIVTGDGGFDFTVDYFGQEKGIFPLLIGTSYIALNTLSTGHGTFILKIFDTFEEYTQLFIFLLSSCFQKWTLYKPAMSRPCNSEQYFIGSKFIGNNNDISKILKLFSSQFFTTYSSQINDNPLIDFDMSIFITNSDKIYNKDLFNDFKKVLYNIQEKRLNEQIHSLDISVQWAQKEHNTTEINELWKQIFITSKEYCNYFQIPINKSLII